jgi:hypothetical protein
MLKDLNNGFEELIRNKLEDYVIPVDSSNWDAIEKSLIRRKGLKYVYTAASIVAAAVVLFLITLYLPENIEGYRSGDSPIDEIFGDLPFPPIQSNVTKLTDKDTTKQNQQAPVNLSGQKQFVPGTVLAYNTEVNAIVTQIEKSELHPEDPPVKEKLKITPQAVSGISINLSPSKYIQYPNNRLLTETLIHKPADKKNDNNMLANKTVNLNKEELENRGWSISMSFGAGSYQNVTGNKRNAGLIAAAPLLTSSNSANYVKNKYKDEIMVPDNADSEYGLPLSAKVIARKDFGKRWAVESGINYTYLPTKYKWNKNTVNQHLHYLGIPLNVVYYVVSKPSWNIYASAGGMVEKGVYSYIHRKDNLKTKADMKGLQWSVNGTMGTTYKLYKNLGIFFEPQFGYFFDNGQPESIRTAWPVSFNLGIGLRFNF